MRLPLVGDDTQQVAVTADLHAGALRLTAHDVFRAPADDATLWQVNELNQRLAPVRVYLKADLYAATVYLYAAEGPRCRRRSRSRRGSCSSFDVPGCSRN